MFKNLQKNSLVMGILSLGMIAASSPSLAEVHGVNLLIKSKYNSQYCVDASLDRKQEGREVYIYKCHGRENQRWTFTDGTDGASAVVGIQGLCLDIRGRSVKDNTPVQLWRCHYGANQQFKVTSLGQIREVQSGKCLTIGKVVGDRKPVFIDECDGNRKQLWVVTK